MPALEAVHDIDEPTRPAWLVAVLTVVVLAGLALLL